MAVVFCGVCELNQFLNIIINLIFAITGTIILYSFGVHLNHFNFIGNHDSKEFSKGLSIFFTLISLFWASQANSFPNVIHNNMEVINENIKIKLSDQETIIDTNKDEENEEINNALQDMILLYDNLKFDNYVTNQKSDALKYVRNRLTYLQSKSIDTNNDIKKINSWYFNVNNRKENLNKNTIQIKNRLNNYNFANNNTYHPELPYLSSKFASRQNVATNYKKIMYLIQQFENIMDKVNLSPSDVAKLDSISFEIKNQFDDIDQKLQPVITDVRHMEEILENKEIFQRIVEKRLTMVNY
ncbi:MAG: hypothetical protein WCG23_10295 [bacterium]